MVQMTTQMVAKSLKEGGAALATFRDRDSGQMAGQDSAERSACSLYRRSKEGSHYNGGNGLGSPWQMNAPQ